MQVVNWFRQASLQGSKAICWARTALCRHRSRRLLGSLHWPFEITANPRTNIADFRGFASNIILIQRGGILRPIGNFLESLSQAMLVGGMVVERLGVHLTRPPQRLRKSMLNPRASGVGSACTIFIMHVCIYIYTHINNFIYIYNNYMYVLLRGYGSPC